MSEKQEETKEKPGFKTSEFWIMVAVFIIGVLIESDALGEGHWAMKVAALAMQGLSAMGYTAGRAKTKFGASLERAEEKKAVASLGKLSPEESSP